MPFFEEGCSTHYTMGTLRPTTFNKLYVLQSYYQIFNSDTYEGTSTSDTWLIRLFFFADRIVTAIKLGSI